jgi:MarR family transcriptional regulator, transcriptional regulator for hemolysin
MVKKRTNSAKVDQVTRAITATRSPEFLPVTKTSSSADEISIPTATSDASREGIRLGFLIHDVSRMRRSAYDQFMKPLGVTRAQWWVLAYLSRHDGMMQTQLADVLEVGKASLGDVIESLERNGWVERRPDPTDKRAKRVYLAKPAQVLIKRMTTMEDDFNSQILAELDPAERAELYRSLQKIKNALSRLAPSSSSASPTSTE